MSGSVQADLDRPVWAALTTKQAHLGHGDALARRYHADVAPFAALASETPAAYRALHRLLLPREQVVLPSAEPMASGDALELTRVGLIHQMVATRYLAESADGANEAELIQLRNGDAADMLELVQRTKPGPFGKRTCETGNYIGIRDEGRLVAMAGERMRVDGYVEISAVCVDQTHRGKGMAGRLVTVLRRQIEQRGQTAFLHVLSDNASAIRLYERLGFELRRTFHLTRVKRADADAAR